MKRPNQLLHLQRTPVQPLHAATVLLLRENAQGLGLEVLMTRRSAKASFAASAYVFPGGGIEAQDASPAAHAVARHRPGQDEQRLTEVIAGIRETFEELGLLLAWRADGSMADDSDVARLDRAAPLFAQCEKLHLSLAADTLRYLAHWTADRDLPRRFSTPFFIARMPEGQTPVADETEQFEPIWVRPEDALARHHAGNFEMIYPTIRTLEKLCRFASVQAVFDALPGEEPLWRATPRCGLLNGQQARYMPGEAPYGELAMACPDGQVQHTLDWQSTHAVPLRKNLQRLTAPNSGMMTGPGTNSYLVGDEHTGFIAIDPGPDDAEHIQRLFDAAGGDIRQIVCTHSHADHSPGAAPLQALVVASGRARPPILGLPSGPTARSNSQFTPDRALSNHELLALTGIAPDNKITHTLEVIFTPGHASNHLCLLLQEDALLFSGDHILNGSTTVIDAPDGNMAAYLDSLDVLDAVCLAHEVEFILPAHGYVLEDARGAIAQLKKHRLAREAKVLAAMRALPQGSLEDWVAHAYADTPPALWPVAKRSLMAHVERIEALGLLQA